MKTLPEDSEMLQDLLALDCYATVSFSFSVCSVASVANRFSPYHGKSSHREHRGHGGMKTMPDDAGMLQLSARNGRDANASLYFSVASVSSVANRFS